MKSTCYLRVAQTSRGLRYVAGAKPSVDPIDGFPTRQFKLVLELPDDIFDLTDAEITAKIPRKNIRVLAHSQEVD